MNEPQSPNESQNGHLDPYENVYDCVNLWGGKFRAAIEALPDYLKHCDEFELDEYAGPTPVDWKMRNRFMDLVRQARAKDEASITLTALLDGIVSRQHFLDKVVTNPNKVAFIVRPLVEHTHYYEAIQQVVLRKLLNYVKVNEIDQKNLGNFMKLVEKATDRVHGAVAQKMQIQSKNLNVDVTASAGQLQSAQGAEDIQTRISSLQNKLLDSGVRDVSETEDPS